MFREGKNGDKRLQLFTHAGEFTSVAVLHFLRHTIFDGGVIVESGPFMSNAHRAKSKASEANAEEIDEESEEEQEKRLQRKKEKEAAKQARILREHASKKDGVRTEQRSESDIDRERERRLQVYMHACRYIYMYKIC